MTNEEIEKAFVEALAASGITDLSAEYSGNVERWRTLFRAGLTLAYEEAARATEGLKVSGLPSFEGDVETVRAVLGHRNWTCDKAAERIRALKDQLVQEPVST